MFQLPSKAWLALASVAAVALGVATAPGAAGAAPTAPRPPAAAQGAIADPDTTLGPNWRTSSDVLVTGAGDSRGFHLYVADEKRAFAWRTLATLTSSALDVGAWTGQVCVTGSGRYAVAVFAPSVAANKPSLMNAGALAAVVEIATGKARHVASGVQLAYFNPACGTGDRALLTRAIGEDQQQTDLLAVDAAAGKVTGTRRIKAQLTTPVPAPDGDYGIAGGKLVRVAASGALTAVAHPTGQPFGVHATGHSGVDLISVVGKQAVAQRFAGGRLTTIGTGPWDKLELFGLPGGRTALVGDVRSVRPAVPELTALTSGQQVEAVSAQGHLLAERVLNRQIARTVRQPLAPLDERTAGAVDVVVRAVHTGRTATGTVVTTKASTLDALPAGHAAPGDRKVKALDGDTPKCAIPRNDPKVQANQPSPNQVEWAADLAVKGQLGVFRPANFLKTGQPAYTPQGMFPVHDLVGGGRVPAQVLLAILAQETNMAQASWHAVRGDLGNPLVSDYYGNRKVGYETIAYSEADCGYGMGQVTTGMNTGETVYTHAQQVAIATDYAANIAASLNVLIDKWNQANTDPEGRTWLNNGESKYIENWFIAVWAYNSGFKTTADKNLPEHNGRVGIGWLNNPANPTFTANRHRFLSDGDDAAKPGEWSYPERIMGWAEHPQWEWNGPISTDKYVKPVFGKSAGDNLTLPGPYVFCSPQVNSCDPLARDQNRHPCPAESSACWWHGHATFVDCSTHCATEKLTYQPGSPEPELKRMYERTCDDGPIWNDVNWDKREAIKIVYTLNDTGQYALGCDITVTHGKFTLRFGDSPGSGGQVAEIDLHQLGAGYKGHIWFTHTTPSYASAKHKVTATWTPDLELAEHRYDILAHLPSHGGEYDPAEYVIAGDPMSDTTQECKIDQGTGTVVTNGTDKWVYLGNYTLKRGGRVMLNNLGPITAEDVAFDSMAFVPTKDGAGHKCKDGED